MTDVTVQFRLDEPLLTLVKDAAELRGTSVEQFALDAMLWQLARPRSRNVREGYYHGWRNGHHVRGR